MLLCLRPGPSRAVEQRTHAIELCIHSVTAPLRFLSGARFCVCSKGGAMASTPCRSRDPDAFRPRCFKCASRARSSSGRGAVVAGTEAVPHRFPKGTPPWRRVHGRGTVQKKPPAQRRQASMNECRDPIRSGNSRDNAFRNCRSFRASSVLCLIGQIGHGFPEISLVVSLIVTASGSIRKSFSNRLPSLAPLQG